MIHHAYYPHIIDLIFHYAPFDLLLVMTATCRQWRERALEMIDHIYDYDTVGFYIPHGTTVEKGTRHCRILDVKRRDGPTPHGLSVGIRKFQDEGLIPALHTVRLMDTAYLRKPPTIHVNAPRVVYERFQPDKYSPSSARLELDRDAETEFERCSALSKLVINHTSRNIGCVGRSTGRLSHYLQQVVFVFHGKETCPCCLHDFLHEAGQASKSVTVSVVGAETLRDLSSLQRYDIQGKTLISREDPQGSWPSRPVKLLTHEEYRQSIGEREYAIETCQIERRVCLWGYRMPWLSSKIWSYL